jgi:hypothetical protein
VFTYPSREVELKEKPLQVSDAMVKYLSSLIRMAVVNRTRHNFHEFKFGSSPSDLFVGEDKWVENRVAEPISPQSYTTYKAIYRAMD